MCWKAVGVVVASSFSSFSSSSSSNFSFFFVFFISSLSRSMLTAKRDWVLPCALTITAQLQQEGARLVLSSKRPHISFSGFRQGQWQPWSSKKLSSNFGRGNAGCVLISFSPPSPLKLAAPALLPLLHSLRVLACQSSQLGWLPGPH